MALFSVTTKHRTGDPRRLASAIRSEYRRSGILPFGLNRSFSLRNLLSGPSSLVTVTQSYNLCDSIDLETASLAKVLSCRPKPTLSFSSVRLRFLCWDRFICTGACYTS